MPQDPSSGAARSLHTICQMLAENGFDVRALATTATERSSRSNARTYLGSMGISVNVHKGSGKHVLRPELQFQSRGIQYRLLDVADKGFMQWQKLYGRQYDLMFDDELQQFDPDAIFTFGAFEADVRRHERAQRRGTKLVFGLRNLSYFKKGVLDHADAVLTPSRFLSDKYNEVIGLRSTPLPTPLEQADVLAEQHEPIFVTMVNPSPEKGLMFFARLAEEISVRRPTIAILAIESRGTSGMLVRAGLAGGYDLRRHENIMISGPVATPKDIYDPCRVLLVPSVCEEPSGRVIPEALMNGVPPIVSDRGGMAEASNGGGFVLPIPREIQPGVSRPVAAEAVEPWIELILRLADDEPFYQEAVARAREASRIYLKEQLAPRYVRFFRDVLTGDYSHENNY